MTCLLRLAVGTALLTAAAASAAAQSAAGLSEFERPFGYAYGEESQPFRAANRDANGNQVVVNGRMMFGRSTLHGGLSTAWGQTEGAAGMLGTGSAIGNQLNVVTHGSNNTIVIDAEQVNTGDQTVVLNGELDLDD